MRALHVIPSIAPHHGGPSVAVIEMVRALRKRSVEAELATTDEGVSNLFHETLVDHDGIPARFFKREATRLPLLDTFAFSPAMTSWLRKAIGRYDLLHIHGLFSHVPTSTMRIARAANVPYVCRPLGMLGTWPLRQSRWRKWAYLRLVEHANLRHAAALHFVSDREATEAEALRLNVPGVVIPHGVTPWPRLPDARKLLRRRFDLPAETPLVLFLGRLHAKKGLDLLLRAFAQLPEPRPILLVAGDGPQRIEIARLAAMLGLRRHIHFAGFVAGEGKQLCLQGADLFALPSQHENFGLAVLEALAVGTPVLVSSHVALASFVEQFQLGQVVPLRVEAISAALALGLSCPSTESERTGRRSIVARHFGWAATAESLEVLYRSLSLDRSTLPRQSENALAAAPPGA